MNFHTTSFRVSIALLIVVSLFIFNINQPPLKSKQQLRYEQWLRDLEPQLLHAKDASSLPKIGLVLQATGAKDGLRWQLTTDRPQHASQILRLLELAREADLFSGESQSDPDALVLTIRHANGTFESRISPLKAQQSVQALSFLKLFELYASNPIMDK